MEQAGRAEEARARSHLYGLLARIVRSEVDAALLADLRRPEVSEALQSAGVDLGQVLGQGDDARLLDDLTTGYTYLYLLTLNPHESVQRGEGQLWGNHTVAAREFMEEVGLSLDEDARLLPDHMAVELEVMQLLAAGEAEALEREDSDAVGQYEALQRRYLKEHLGAWGVEFFGAAERLANQDFYRQMARLARDFLHSETTSVR